MTVETNQIVRNFLIDLLIFVNGLVRCSLYISMSVKAFRYSALDLKMIYAAQTSGSVNKNQEKKQYKERIGKKEWNFCIYNPFYPLKLSIIYRNDIPLQTKWQLPTHRQIYRQNGQQQGSHSPKETFFHIVSALAHP